MNFILSHLYLLKYIKNIVLIIDKFLYHAHFDSSIMFHEYVTLNI